VDLAHAQRALDRATALTGVGERRPRGAAHRARHVRVAEHEHRVLAVQGQDRALQPARAGLPDLPAGAGRAGEADLVDRRGDERRARVRVTVHHLQQALGQPGAREDPRDALGAQRHVGRGLEDHAVASHQRHGRVAQRRGEGLGGGSEHAHDAERLVRPAPTLHRVLRAREADALAAEDRRSVLGQPLQRLDCRQELHNLGLGARAPLLSPDHVDELVELVDHGLGGARHVATAVGQAQRRPQPLHAGSLLDGGSDVARRRDWHCPQPLAGGRVERLELRGGDGLHREARLPLLALTSWARARG
jgi:hypothetical protein